MANIHTFYEVAYSTSKKFSAKKTKYANAGAKAKGKTIKKLKAKTTYYVQVRTYTKSKRKTYYSKWSAKKSVKTK